MSDYLPLRLRANPRRRSHRLVRLHRVIRRHNYRRHKAHYLVRHNPGRLGGIVKRTFTKQNLAPVAGITVGFLGGSIVANKVRDWVKDQKWESGDTISKWVGVLNLILGAAMTVKGKGTIAKSAGTGVALSGAYDIVQVNVESLSLPSINPKIPGMDDDKSAPPATVKGLELGWIGARVRNRANAMAGLELAGDPDTECAL